MSFSVDDTDDKIDFLGYLLGAAIGDIIGAGIEMKNREWTKRNKTHLLSGLVNSRTGRYAVNYVSGFYTDDTEHLCANMKAVMEGSSNLLRFYKLEYDATVNILGIGRQGHGGIFDYYINPSPSTLSTLYERNKATTDPGNAPIMRASVFGFTDTELIEWSLANANVTHPHDDARLGSIIIASTTRYLVVKRSHQKDVIANAMTRSVANPKFLHYLMAVDKLPSYHDSPIDYDTLTGKGSTGLPCSAMFTVGCILYLLKHARGAYDLLEQSILLGGDIDSCLSVCLSIYGAMKKLDIGKPEGLPSWVLDRVEEPLYLNNLAESFTEWYYKQKH